VRALDGLDRPHVWKTVSSNGENMSRKNTALFGIYPTHASADAAVDTFKLKGFRHTDIAVMFPQNAGSKEFGHEKGAKSAEGAVAGGGVGAAVGGALAWLAGIGVLVIPGTGPYLAAGTVIAVLAGMGAGGAIGGVVGALVGLAIPEYQAKRYEGRMRKGGILLSVHADDQEWISKGRQILEQTGAEHIAQVGETRGDFGNSDRPTAPIELVARPIERVAPPIDHVARPIERIAPPIERIAPPIEYVAPRVEHVVNEPSPNLVVLP
jgi:hypothetical protein